MNTAKLRSKRIILPTLAAVVALGVGGTVWASAANADVSGGERDRVAEAAVRAAGGGTATDVESSDDRGEAYEVEVRKDDGSEDHGDLPLLAQRMDAIVRGNPPADAYAATPQFTDQLRAAVQGSGK